MSARTILIAKALVIDAENNVLILRRSHHAHHRPLLPDLPGGSVDDNESAHQAVVRELHEEAGLVAAPSDAHLAYTNTSFENGSSRIRQLFVVWYAEIKPTVQLSWEHTQFEWVAAGEAAGKLEHPIYAAGLDYLLTHSLMPDLKTI